MIRSLERDGLVEKRPNPADGRTKRLCLTRAGRSEMRELDRIADRARGVGIDAARPTNSGAAAARPGRGPASARASRWSRIAPEDPSSADARWCLAHYFAELGERFEERFDPGRTLPADSKDMTPPSGAFLLARFDGQPAGCGALKTLSPGRRRDHEDVGRPRPPWAWESAPGSSARSKSRRWRLAITACASTPTAHSTRRRRCIARTATRRSPATTTTHTQIIWFEKRLGPG